jgi:hypothetical protein
VDGKRDAEDAEGVISVDMRMTESTVKSLEHTGARANTAILNTFCELFNRHLDMRAAQYANQMIFLEQCTCISKLGKIQNHLYNRPLHQHRETLMPITQSTCTNSHLRATILTMMWIPRVRTRTQTSTITWLYVVPRTRWDRVARQCNSKEMCLISQISQHNHLRGREPKLNAVPYRSL